MPTLLLALVSNIMISTAEDKLYFICTIFKTKQRCQDHTGYINQV